jgi:hypothetical protein
MILMADKYSIANLPKNKWPNISLQACKLVWRRVNIYSLVIMHLGITQWLNVRKSF